MIRAYCRLRKLTDPLFPLSHVPQLLITGFGSIDDPEGTIIYEKTLEFMDEEEFADYERDMVVVPLPPSDQLLNALLRSTKICLQLSIREGFEIKATEALAKGIPVIAYRTGGLVNQVDDGKSGYLVDPGDYESVASLMQTLLTDTKLYNDMSTFALQSFHKSLCTPFQAANWFWLFNYVMEEDQNGSKNGEMNDTKLNTQNQVAEAVQSRDVSLFWNH